MRHNILALALFVGALSQVACNQNQPPNPSQAASNCVAAPPCAQMVMQSGASGPMLIPLGTAMAAQPVPAALGTTLPASYAVGSQAPAVLARQPFRAATVANAAIQAQSSKIASALAADDANPLSPNYKVPAPDLSKSEAEGNNQASANRQPSTAADLAPASSGDLGEATR
jgi:hypothetical protein